MKKENYIDITTICMNYNVSDTFVIALYDFNLIQIEEINNIKYISMDEMKEFEKFARMYNELEINPEGIDAIYHLMRRMQTMEEEITLLKQRLKLYEAEE